jgi:hypothetical protein
VPVGRDGAASGVDDGAMVCSRHRSRRRWGRGLGLALGMALAACQGETTAAACAVDLDCPTGGGICDDGACRVLACRGRGDCPSGTCGLDGLCKPAECDPARPCEGGFTCHEGLCRSPEADGREVGVTTWDTYIVPSPLPPDAFRADAAPDVAVPPMADALRPPRPDAAAPSDGSPSPAADARTTPETDTSAPDAGPGGDAGDRLADFFALTFAFDHGDCDLREPAAPKDLWLEEGEGGALVGRLTTAGGGTGVDVVGQRDGAALHLRLTAPLLVIPLCETQLDLGLELVIGGDGALSGLADWHTFTAAADCPAPVDCHRFDRVEGAPPAP